MHGMISNCALGIDHSVLRAAFIRAKPRSGVEYLLGGSKSEPLVFLSALLIRCSYFCDVRLLITVFMVNTMQSKNENLPTNPSGGGRPDCDRDYFSSSNARRGTPSGILNDLQLRI